MRRKCSWLFLILSAFVLSFNCQTTDKKAEPRNFRSGGKASDTEDGGTKFVYSNDVWAMSKKTE